MPTDFVNQFFARFLPDAPELRQAISAHFEPVAIPRNALILEAGNVSNMYYLLESGFLRAFTIDVEGNEVTTAFYCPGNVVFEPYSFFMRAPSGESFQAITDCSAYQVSFEKLNMLFHSIPEFRELGRGILVKEFAAYKKRTLALINRSAEERYADLFETSRELFQVAQLKHIASYLGITDTSLSRIRRDFSKK
jgi:CRP-like cAMP-binding protein